MDKSQFWQLIEASKNKRGDCDKQAVKLQKLLSKLSAEEMMEFDRILDECSEAAYRYDLWGAAYIINCGASDDGFQYFRWWLISQGQEYFEAALANPERSGDKADPDKPEKNECEAIAYCAMSVYQEKTGEEMPPRPYNPNGSAEPIGTPWEEDDLEALFPALCEKFG